MPLDVQPLSNARRATMVLVMLGLLAGSLGFAQYLVRKQKPALAYAAVFTAPFGVDRMPVNTSLDEALKYVTVQINGQPRVLAAFDLDADWAEGMTEQQILDALFETLPGAPNAVPGPPIRAILGRMAALQRMVVAAEPQPRFDVLRMVIAGNTIVAFGFSGQGELTENDTNYFENYCQAGIKISRQLVQP